MTPFSPFYYVSRNKPRCILLIVMLMLSAIIYVGGLYVTSPNATFELFNEHSDNFIYMVDRAVISGNESHFDEFIAEVEADEDLKYFYHTPDGAGFWWNTVMGFECGSMQMSFCYVDDFKIYCEKLGIEVDFTKLRPGSLVLTQMLANNLGLSLGDTIDENTKSKLFEVHEGRSFTVDYISDRHGYGAFMLSDYQNKQAIQLYSNTLSGQTLREKALALGSKYDILVGGTTKEEIASQFSSFNFIYGFIVILVSVILAITINTAFSGMYQKRNFELAVYRAIGIKKKKIFSKLVLELIIIDGIALIAGGIITILFLYIFNNTVLYPKGLYLEYFHPLALAGVLICNLISLLPLILFRIRQIKKADICEY